MTMLPSSHLPAEVKIPLVQTEPIDIVAFLQMAHHPKAGGMVLFSGEVRNHHAGKDVLYLEYEVYPSMAEKMIEEIVSSAKEKWGLHYACCVHRFGKIDVCESAVVVITSHAHRKEAYQANQYIIDRVKHEVPIWKKEYYVDGTSSWGGSCHCH